VLSESGLEAGDVGKFYFNPGFTSIFLHAANVLSYAVYVNPNDALLGETDKIFSGSLTGSGAESSPSPTLPEYLTAPFSMTEVLTLTLAGTGSFLPTIDGSVTVFAPEPSALACLGAGLLLLGLTRASYSRILPSPWKDSTHPLIAVQDVAM